MILPFKNETDLKQRHLSANTKHAYRIHSNLAGISRYQQFIKNNFIALGWSTLGDISSLTEEELRTKISNLYNKKGQGLGLIIGYFRRMMAMNPGDLLVIPDHKTRVVTLAEVTGHYYYDPQLITDDCAHTVPFRQLRVIGESELPEKSLKSIQTRTSLITLDSYLNEIIELANGGSAAMNITTVEYVEQATTITGKNLLLRYDKGVTKQQILDFVSQLNVK